MQELNTLDPHIVLVMISASLSVGCVFMFCMVGSYTMDNFLRFAGISYESLWYKFPIDLQKYLQMFIVDGHRLVVFRGLDIIDLNLMTYSRVCRKSARRQRRNSHLNFLGFSGDANRRHLLFDVKKFCQII